jgi:hypothetical protein
VSGDGTRLDNVDTVGTLESGNEVDVELGPELIVGQHVLVNDLLDLYAGKGSNGLDIGGTDTV